MNDVYNDLFEIQSLVCQNGPWPSKIRESRNLTIIYFLYGCCTSVRYTHFCSKCVLSNIFPVISINVHTHKVYNMFSVKKKKVKNRKK